MTVKCVPIKRRPDARPSLGRAHTTCVWMLTHCVDYGGIITGPWMFTERWAAKEFGDLWCVYMGYEPIVWRDHLEYNCYYLTRDGELLDQYMQLESILLDQCWVEYARACGL